MRAVQAARSAGLPADAAGDYELLSGYGGGNVPKSVGEAAQALAAAQRLAQAQGLKPAALRGTDLQWPPAETFTAPLGYAPYVPRLREVLEVTMPKRRGSRGSGSGPVAVPAEAVDPMAAMRAMTASAGNAVRADPGPSVDVPELR